MPASAIRVFTRTGVVFAADLRPAQKSVIAHHWNAIRRYLEYGDDTALVDLERDLGPEEVRLGRHVLSFDLDEIEYHAFRGDVRFESIYDEVV